ncbi:MAG: Unknown protein [uncultured Sulfurovum sp.]|uniref:Rhodanese domain-containing protein n=1 Tax=uncultured Sulfurovum sp. TaxID=269237 RepID=A0A6S6SRF5_9BACT|nr:MAG: Unknown protein [uncultured Sulfurovum sp.]
MMKINLLLILLTVNLLSKTEIGCNVLLKQEPMGCSVPNVLTESKPLIVVDTPILKKNITAISEQLDVVEVLHEDKKLKIERLLVDKFQTCPPFCIEPMNIQDVKTVGELETLAFIEKLKEKQAQLLVDVRENRLYQSATIPGAVNLPLRMLEDKSQYQTAVLELLGAKTFLNKGKRKWTFKNVQSLLIFGNSVSSNEASRAIKKLLALGYPSHKLRYYRAGINAWTALGLSTYSSK